MTLRPPMVALGADAASAPSGRVVLVSRTLAADLDLPRLGAVALFGPPPGGTWAAAEAAPPGVAAILIAEGERALGERMALSKPSVVVTEVPRGNAAGAILGALAAALEDAERAESEAMGALLELRLETRLQEKALDRHRRFVAQVGLDPYGHDVLTIHAGERPRLVPATGLSQLLPDVGPTLQRVVVPVWPPGKDFHSTPGRLDVRLVGRSDGQPIVALAFSVPAARLAGGELRAPVPSRAHALDSLSLELDWRGLPENAPRVATAPHGLSEALDLRRCGGRLAGRMLAARYQATLAPIDEFPPRFTIEYTADGTEGWRVAPPGLLAYGTLGHAPPDDIPYSLCVYHSTEDELLVHPVSHEHEVWARVDGIIPPGARAVWLTARLDGRSYSPVEFAAFAAPEEASFDDVDGLRGATAWLMLEAGDTGPLVCELDLVGAPRTLWLGTRLAAGENLKNWCAHAFFAKPRVRL